MICWSLQGLLHASDRENGFTNALITEPPLAAQTLLNVLFVKRRRKMRTYKVLLILSLGMAGCSNGAEREALKESSGLQENLSRDPCVNFVCPADQHCIAPVDVPYCTPNAP